LSTASYPKADRVVDRLNTGRSVPSATAMGSGGSCAAAVDNPETDDCRGKEEDSSQEGESDISLELGALRLSSDAMPIPNTAAVHRSDIVDEETKGNDVENEEDEVGGPMEEAGGKWEEEDEGEEDAEGRDNLSVDESLLGPC